MYGYAVALVASWCYQGATALRDAPSTDAPTTTGSGADAGCSFVRPYPKPLNAVEARVAWKAWRAPLASQRPPVILIHGAPGGKEDWYELAPLLAADGRDVYSIDLPGFGDSSLRVPDHSVRGGARALLAWMDANAIERAHVVGWSNGGGVALHLAHDAPERVASLTLLASIGQQRFEGSGSHLLEHLKYDLGMLVLGPGIDLLPHFGALGTRDARTGWLRSFGESDQRPFETIMREIGEAGRPETLIVHGRDDFLVPVRTAVRTHASISGSRLVLMDAMHFIPFMQQDVAAPVLNAFFAATDGAKPGGPTDAVARPDPAWLARGATVDLDTPLQRSPIQRAVEPARDLIRSASPWLVLAAIGVFAFFFPALAAACAVMLVLGLDIDYFVAVLGVFAGLCGRDLIAAGWALRTYASGARRAPSSLEARLRLTPGSSIDWARRLSLAPFHEAWTACVMRDVRESSAGPAALVSATLAQRTSFVVGRLFGLALVASVSVMGSFVIAILALGALHGPARTAFAREDLDIALLWAPMLVLLLLTARTLPLLLSTRGRTRLYVFIRRCLHHEFWQSFWFYVPFWPVCVWLIIKHRGLLVWTCCNPGIGAGGGILGECKTECFERLGAPDLARRHASGPAPAFDPERTGVWPYATIPAGPSPSERAAMALDVLEREATLGGLPIVLKPDQGLRGLGLKLARTHEQLAQYFENVTAAVIMQRFHPGPLECSVLWTRNVPPSAPGEPVGSIYSITTKQFQVLEGDGVRTLEELIDRDRRARLQRDTFRERHQDRLSWVPAKGERLPLNVAGNHCQGTIFRDGEHLRSPGLERAIDRFCASYQNDALDLVRLDIRYRSDEDLCNGVGLAIVDINGTMGESVNMYDPDHWYPWALRVLSGHWARMFAIGAWRRSMGARPLTLRELIRMRGFYDERRGSRVSD